MAVFVLIHGGWQGGWAWDGVVQYLQSKGHTAYAPTLPGMDADDNEVQRASATMSSMAASVCQFLQENDLKDVVLVGHSGGGPIIQFVADQVPERVKQAVFASAWVLYDGESINSVIPGQTAEYLVTEAARRPDASAPIEPEMWKSRRMQDATEDQLKEFIPRMVPTPIGWVQEPIKLNRFFDLEIPFSYILMRQDLAAPQETYHRMANRLPRVKKVECEGSHQVITTNPKEFSEGLLRAVF